MKRIVTMLTVALAMAAMVLASVMPAFAQGQGPEGGNPGQGIPQEGGKTVGANNLRPLPFGGQTEEVLPGGNTSGLDATDEPVVCTASGSPFFNPDAPFC